MLGPNEYDEETSPENNASRKNEDYASNNEKKVTDMRTANDAKLGKSSILRQSSMLSGVSSVKPNNIEGQQ